MIPYRRIWNEHNPDNPWKPGYLIHHIDGNRKNNHISNLQLVTKSEHNKIHFTGEKNPNYKKDFSKETREKMSRSQLGNKNSLGYKQTIQHRKNESESHKGKPNNWVGRKHSEESKIKMRKAWETRVVSEETKKKMSDSRKRYLLLLEKEKINDHIENNSNCYTNSIR